MEPGLAPGGGFAPTCRAIWACIVSSAYFARASCNWDLVIRLSLVLLCSRVIWFSSQRIIILRMMSSFELRRTSFGPASPPISSSFRVLACASLSPASDRSGPVIIVF